MARSTSDADSSNRSSDGFQLHHADTRQLYDHLSRYFSAADLNDGLVDVTITSPPYADKKDYGYDPELQVGLGQSYEKYLEELRSIYRQTYQITRDSGTLWVVVNTIKKDQRVVQLPFDIRDVCENLERKDRCDQCDTRLIKDRETGQMYCDQCGEEYDPLEKSWRLQDIIIWDKKRARPWSRKGQFRNVFEYILCFSKTKDFKFDLDSVRIADPNELKQWWVNYPERYNPRGKVPNNIWEMVTPTQGSWGHDGIDHPAPFPRELVERIVRLTTDREGIVFDPFAGTGTVLAQAEVMGRHGIGIELSEEYVEAYSDLYDEIEEEWNNRQKQGDTLKERQNRLEELICALRQLKYPRELTRRIRKDLEVGSLEELGVNSAIQISHGTDHEQFDQSHLFIENELYIVTDDSVSSDRIRDIQDSAERWANQPPCSKFGIVADIEVLTLEGMQPVIDEAKWADEALYLYNNDTQNVYARTITFDDWLHEAAKPEAWREKHAKNHYPPILSNLGIKVDQPKDDWRKEREKKVLTSNSVVSSQKTTKLSDF